MLIKISDLKGVALDWAVAKCETTNPRPEFDYFFMKNHGNGFGHYSTDWSKGGPIIEREGIYLKANNCATEWAAGALSINRFDKRPGPLYYGLAPLIAAMRCYVASKLGYEVEVPDELA
jgi:Protein of unknown function (DUF2591)